MDLTGSEPTMDMRVTGFLADLSREMAGAHGWREGVCRGLRLLDSLFSPATVVLGLDLSGWRVIGPDGLDEDACPDGALYHQYSTFAGKPELGSLSRDMVAPSSCVGDCDCDFLTVPLRFADEVMGVLSVVWTTGGRSVGALDILTVAAALIAPRIREARGPGPPTEEDAEFELGRLPSDGAERTLEALLEFVPEGIAIFDGDEDRVRMVSKYGEEMARETAAFYRACAGGSRIVRIYDEEAGSHISREDIPIVKAAIDGSRITNREISVEMVDGTRLALLCNAGPIRDDSGEVVGSVMAWRDIGPIRAARERMSRQLQSLQRALLPDAPSIGRGYAVASAYLPAYDGQEIGGDFYDVFSTRDGKVCILIGDVSGKGIEAASLAAATRSTLRAFVYDSSSASDALTRANSLLTRHQFGPGSFASAFVAVLDLDAGDISYSGAGHPPPVTRRADGSIMTLNSGSPPVGILDGMTYTSSHKRLMPGDKLLLYTDGISEARRGGNLFGQEGLERVLHAHGESSPDSLLQELLSAAEEWARGRIRDDVAVVIIERGLQGDSD